MTKSFRIVTGVALVAALAAQPAFAQAARKPAASAATAPAPTGNVVRGVAILNVDGVIANSDAYRYAAQQQQTIYKAQLDQAQQRKVAYEAQRKPMVDKLQADANAKRPEAELQTQIDAIQKLDQQAEQDINQIVQPVALSDAYVKEQIASQFNRAVANAMSKNGITLVLAPNAVLIGQQYDMSPAVVGELNVLIPASKVQVIPPQGWVPREARQQQGAPQAANPAQPRPATPAATQPKPAVQPKPAGPQPEGR